jgi:hypothetical protein
MIETRTLKDAERLARIAMAIILLTAGISKLCSHGGFFGYYSKLFQGDLRIRLPKLLVDAYLHAIPFIEAGLGCSLLVNRYKRAAVVGWMAFFMSILMGHYILQEWSVVNEIVPFLLLGLFAFILPNHSSWLRRDA